MTRWKRHRLIRQFALLAILLALIAAVANDAIHGPSGLQAKKDLEKRVEGLKADLATLKRERARLERNAELLGERAAQEPVLLEEKARALLDLAHPADIIIVDDPDLR